jgi:hypothetical protein
VAALLGLHEHPAPQLRFCCNLRLGVAYPDEDVSKFAVPAVCAGGLFFGHDMNSPS